MCSVSYDCVCLGVPIGSSALAYDYPNDLTTANNNLHNLPTYTN